MFIFLMSVSIALVFSFLCSIFESVLLTVGHARIEKLTLENKPAGFILKRFKNAMEQPIAAILILNTIAHTVGASLAGWSFEKEFQPTGTQILIFTSTFTVAILLFTEIVPKTLGITFHNTLATPVAYAVQALVVSLRPLLYLTSAMTRLLKGSAEPPITSVEEIRLLAALGHAEGVVGEKFAAIIDGAAKLRKLRVQEVLVPRRRVVQLEASASWETALQTIRESGHSRFPLTETGSLDQVQGIVLAKEVLLAAHQAGNTKPDWQPLLNDPLWVPQTTTLVDLLQTFQEQRKHLAMVVDEYGSVVGIVTMEDILEELVGDIRNEKERSKKWIIKRGPRHLTCRGHAELRTVFKLLELPLDRGQVTLSGFLSAKLDRVPKVGDKVIHGDIVFHVREATNTRAEVVECQPDEEEREALRPREREDPGDRR